MKVDLSTVVRNFDGKPMLGEPKDGEAQPKVVTLKGLLQFAVSSYPASAAEEKRDVFALGLKVFLEDDEVDFTPEEAVLIKRVVAATVAGSVAYGRVCEAFA